MTLASLLSLGPDSGFSSPTTTSESVDFWRRFFPRLGRLDFSWAGTGAVWPERDLLMSVDSNGKTHQKNIFVIMY